MSQLLTFTASVISSAVSPADPSHFHHTHVVVLLQSYNTQRKQPYIILLRKFVHTNMPQVGFELGSLRLQADVLPIEPPLLVTLANLCIPAFRLSMGFCQKFCKQIHETFF